MVLVALFAIILGLMLPSPLVSRVLLGASACVVWVVPAARGHLSRRILGSEGDNDDDQDMELEERGSVVGEEVSGEAEGSGRGGASAV